MLSTTSLQLCGKSLHFYTCHISQPLVNKDSFSLENSTYPRNSERKFVLYQVKKKPGLNYDFVYEWIKSSGMIKENKNWILVYRVINNMSQKKKKKSWY